MTRVAVARRREQVTELVYVQQLSPRQVAERLGVSEPTVRADLDAVHATMRERGDQDLRQSVLMVWQTVRQSFAVRIQHLWADWAALDLIKIEADIRSLELVARNRGDEVAETVRVHLDVRRLRLMLLRELRAEIDHYCDRAEKLGLIAPVPVGPVDGEYVLSVEELRETRNEIDGLLRQLGMDK